jgi:NADH:ubiquinone oxidoreductase subunit K
MSAGLRAAWRDVLTKIVLASSDVQLATGLAIVIIAYRMRCTISV